MMAHDVSQECCVNNVIMLQFFFNLIKVETTYVLHIYFNYICVTHIFLCVILYVLWGVVQVLDHFQKVHRSIHIHQRIVCSSKTFNDIDDRGLG